jgi:hypothetical protein
VVDLGGLWVIGLATVCKLVVYTFDRHTLSLEGTRKEIRVQGKQNASSIWNTT